MQQDVCEPLHVDHVALSSVRDTKQTRFVCVFMCVHVHVCVCACRHACLPEWT